MYYRSGLYRLLATDPRIEFTAIFSSSAGVRAGDLGYGEPVAFDTDALAGFHSVFLRRADRTEADGAFTSLMDRDVVRVVADNRFDALWLHGYYSATHLLAAATQRTLGRSLLIREEQNLLSPRAAWKRALKRPLLRALFAGSYGLSIGTRNEDWFTHYGMAPSRLFRVPFCVDNDFFHREAERLRPQQSELRRSFGLDEGSGPVILCVGRLVPKKQQRVLLEAFHILRSAHRCSLMLVGSGPSEVELRALVDRDDIPDVHFVGFLNQSQISAAYAAADVFALTSGWDETWGLVVNEAMNFGLPVVVSDRVGCAADLVRAGENGFVVRHDRPQELAARLAMLVHDADQRRAFGIRSLEIIRPWNYDAAVVGVLDAIRAAVGQDRWHAAERHAALPPRHYTAIAAE